MAVNYSNLFTLNLKAIIAAVTTMKTWYTDLASIESDINTKYVSASTQYLLGPMKQTVDTAYSAAFSAIQAMVGRATTVLTDRDLILDEMPQLTSQDVQTVLDGIIGEMISGSHTILQNVVTIGAVSSVKTNANAGTIITSKKLSGIDAPAFYARANRKYADLDSQLSLTSDTLKVICTTDSESDGAQYGSETFVVTGKPTAPSLFHWLSKGSGGSTTFTVAQGASLSSDLAFNSFSANLPNGFTAVIGTAGVHFLEETVEVVGGSGSSLEIAGNCELSLPVANLVLPLGHYCVGFLIKSDGLVTGATLNIFLEGTGYTTEGSTTREIVMDATALNAQTNFDLESFNVVLPATVPDDLTLRIEVTGMSAGKIYIDAGFIVRPTYHNGIAVVVSAGRERFLRGDTFTFDVTNSDASAYQTFFRDAFGVQLPSSGSPSIAY